jgi:hypothetical protein
MVIDPSQPLRQAARVRKGNDADMTIAGLSILSSSRQTAWLAYPQYPF